jgi:flagellar M-ring protein FliF
VNEAIVQYRERLAGYWKQVNKTQKMIFIGAIVLLILSIALLTIHFSKTEYASAFTDLDPNDAAAIVTYLEGAGVQYKLSGDGRTIGVPSTMASKVKIDVESQGLMKNGSLGYGIFRDNMSGFGMSENEFNVLNVDAKAGEIQQLINAMNGVSSSKVLINLPEKSVFINTDEPEQSSASVVVKFKPGYSPDQLKIDTIYNLVTHSIPNLPIENITISDQNGELLPSSKSNGEIDNATTIAAQQFLIKKQIETDIQKNVHQMLGTILGRDKVIVSVFASLNFDKRNTQEQLFTPVNTVDQKGIERSVQEIQKSYSSEGGTDGVGGIAGTGTTDVPGYPAAENSGNTNSEELQRTINYEVNQITRQVVSSPYAVKDLTINVGIEPPNANDPSSLTEETKVAIQRILMNIVDASLADSGQTFTDEEIAKKVLVLTHAFGGRPAEAAASSALSNPIWLALGAAALAVVATGSYFVIRNRRKQEIEEEELPPSTILELSSLDQEKVVHDNEVRKQLETLAKKKPDEFVNLLRTWLADE